MNFREKKLYTDFVHRCRFQDDNIVCLSHYVCDQARDYPRRLLGLISGLNSSTLTKIIFGVKNSQLTNCVVCLTFTKLI